MALECKTRHLHPVTVPTVLRATPCLLSDVELVGGQRVHERTHQVVCGEVEDEAEGDGDGEGRKGLLEHGKEQEGETQTLQDTGMREVSDHHSGWCNPRDWAQLYRHAIGFSMYATATQDAGGRVLSYTAPSVRTPVCWLRGGHSLGQATWLLCLGTAVTGWQESLPK